MTPLGIESLPADLVKTLRSLPLMTEQLTAIASSTSEMAAMRAGIDKLGDDTSTLNGIATDVNRIAALLASTDDRVGSVAADTNCLPEVKRALDRVHEATNVLPQMDERMKEIEAAMPVLVEVQGHLAKLPETIETLGVGIDRLATLMDRLLVSMDTLDGNVGLLQTSMEPIANIADRLPGSGPPRS